MPAMPTEMTTRQRRDFMCIPPEKHIQKTHVRLAERSREGPCQTGGTGFVLVTNGLVSRVRATNGPFRTLAET
jgi:hypothetical protein